ncbi:MAG TPA: chromosome segregation protein SMC, partial [Bdellovibrionales bacterium]|nr:chromosome segregation protein SMC [Bdellovibrionales bacterium]
LTAQTEAKSSEVQNHKDRLNQVSSRLYGLQDLDANFEGFQEGVKTVMQWQSQKHAAAGETEAATKFALVADAVSVAPEYEVALEAALGQGLHMILSQNWDDPLAAIQHLKDTKMGRTSFFSAVDQYPVHSAMTLPREEIEAVLLDIVQIKPEFNEPMRALLERIAVVESLEKGLSLRRRFPRWGFVTRQGDVITADGVVTGGTEESADTGVVRRRREIKELTAERDVLSGQLAILQHELDKLEEQTENVRRELENARVQKSEKEIQVAEKRKDLERSESELNNLMQAITKQQKDVADLEAQRNTQQDKYDTCQEELQNLREKAAQLSSDVESMTVEVDRIRKENEARSRVVTDLQVRSAGKTQERDGLKRQVEMYSRNLREVEEQKARMTNESTKTSESLSMHSVQLEQERIRLNQLIDQAEQAKSQLAGLQDEFEKQSHDTRELEAKLSEKVKSIQTDQTTINDLRLKLEQSTLRESNIVSQVFEKYNTQLLEVAEQYRSREVDLVAIESELNDLKDKMSKMGEVSLAAIDEYDELTARYEFLTKQQSDLLDAQAQLRKVIDRIDKICSKQFKETFDAVNERFAKVFPILFGGGMAHLVMIEDPENPGDPGIDIVVRPPGKKSQNITLLSGGEKALTSVALIFSIFLVKPSPFCLLDEVDAPLDDANVFRFNELVKEMAKRSQIIVVTHNKYTMEVNNKLYGVTMEERGVSKMVSVNLTDAQRVAEATA